MADQNTDDRGHPVVDMRVRVEDLATLLEALAEFHGPRMGRFVPSVQRLRDNVRAALHAATVPAVPLMQLRGWTCEVDFAVMRAMEDTKPVPLIMLSLSATEAQHALSCMLYPSDFAEDSSTPEHAGVGAICDRLSRAVTAAGLKTD